MENDVVRILKEMTVDEQLAFIEQLNASSQSDDIDSSINPQMTDEVFFDYLVKQDKGIMTMEEFEQLGTKAIKELFGRI